jgi:hypothetical protein
MSEMIERVAQAICGGDDPASILAIHRRRARAAIEAMREPMENMLFVGSNDEAGFTARNLRESWHLMIEEALK